MAVRQHQAASSDAGEKLFKCELVQLRQLRSLTSAALRRRERQHLLRLEGVHVTRQVQVELVLGDLVGPTTVK
jgi:hypothetical protein